MNTNSAKRLTTLQVAERLGVKVETVYAYASRGLLRSARTPGSRGSTFDAAEVERFAEQGQRTVRGTGFTEDFPRIDTTITRIEDGRFSYRDADAVDLAARLGFERTAGWVWTGRPELPGGFTALPAQIEAVDRVGAAMPASSTLTDRIRMAVVTAAAADPLRYDLRAESVLSAGRAIVAAAVRGVCGPPAPIEAPIEAPIAERLRSALAEDADDRFGPVIDQALALLIDHDLAVSTLAVRVAASARAHPYAVVSAGLGALDGPLHGAAAGECHRILSDVMERGDATALVPELLRHGRTVPGFGHRLYPQGDPRARALFRLLEDVPSSDRALHAARRLTEVVARDTVDSPNVDLALATLCLAGGMVPEAPEAIFAVARVVGWIAHALEEYREPELRFRVVTAHGQGG
ncbi:citrate/2-methylcitrate synthase [Actinocorallia longicatena]|uniref:citrate synthase (unknown stereospecificity) n=1 Tax=Actinocorallia longicatena TaxID=111803 RepID=A0ABP6Q3P6_9ACTN